MLILTFVELSTELDFGLDKLGILTECLLRQLDAKHELASVGHLILILNIWVHITEKQLLLILIGETAIVCETFDPFDTRRIKTC